MVDHEKSRDSAYRAVMSHAHLFLHKHHVVKNILQAVRSEKETGSSLYDHSLKAPSIGLVRIQEQYGPLTTYLRRFSDSEFYKAAS